MAINHRTLIVEVTNTPTPISNTSIPCRSCVIQAHADNSGKCTISEDSDLDYGDGITLSAERCYILKTPMGRHNGIGTIDLSDLHVIANEASGNKLVITYLEET